MAASLDGLHPTLMRPRVEQLLDDPEARTLGVYVVSAFRSIARQAALFAAAVVKYGSPAKARKWVAPPGKSNHGPRVDGYGTAVDLGLPGVKAVSGQWPDDLKRRVDELAERHGLASPMAWEDWHYEPMPAWKPPSTPGSADTGDDDVADNVCVPSWAQRGANARVAFFRLAADTDRPTEAVVTAWNGAKLSKPTGTFGLVPFVKLEQLNGRAIAIDEIEATGAVVVLCDDGGVIDVAARPK